MSYKFNPFTGKLDIIDSANMAIGGNVTSGTSGSILFVDSSGNLAQDNSNLYWDDTNNRLGIGTDSPSGKLDVTGKEIIIGANHGDWDNRTDNTQKTGHITGIHYDIDEEEILFLRSEANLSSNILKWGGGSADFNTATYHLFYTASDTTTTSGSERMRIDSSGRIGIGETSPTAKLHIDTGSATEEGLIIKGSASQSANLQEWKDSSGNTYSYIAPDLSAVFSPILSVSGSDQKRGIKNVSIFDASVSNVTGIQRSLDATAYMDGSYNFSNVRGLNCATYARSSFTGTGITVIGIIGSVGNLSDSGSITTGTSIYAGNYSTGSGAISTFIGFQTGNIGASNITTSYGLNIGSSTGATGTSKYGIYTNNISGASTNNYAIYTNDGLCYFKDKVGMGEKSPTAVLHLKAGTATANTSPLKFTTGTNLSTPEAGTIEYDGYFHITNQGGQRTGLVTSNNLKTTTTTVANTTTETTIYSYTFGANQLHAPIKILFNMSGVFSNASAADDFTLRFKINGATVHTIARTGGLQTNAGWRATHEGTVRTEGVSGTFVDVVSFQANGGSLYFAGEATAHTIDTTSSVAYTVTVQWANAKAGNTFSCTQGDLTFKH